MTTQSRPSERITTEVTSWPGVPRYFADVAFAL
jgi:hypothetical protein